MNPEEYLFIKDPIAFRRDSCILSFGVECKILVS